jgi:hypothetical protein
MIYIKLEIRNDKKYINLSIINLSYYFIIIFIFYYKLFLLFRFLLINKLKCLGLLNLLAIKLSHQYLNSILKLKLILLKITIYNKN